VLDATGPRPHSPPRRRTTRVLLATVAAAALVAAACGGDDSATAPQGDATTTGTTPENCPVDALEDDELTEITVWHPYNTLTKDALEELAAEYNESQDRVRVSVEAQGTYPELQKKYEDSLADPDSLPDVIFSEDSTLQFMMDSESVIPAADCIAADDEAEELFGDLLPAVEQAYTVDGVLWAAGFGVSQVIMYVNNEHLEAAGWSRDEPPTTLTEMREAAEAIRAAEIAGVDSPVVMQLYGWFVENWLTGAGQPVVDEENGRTGLATVSELDNPETAGIVDWLDSMESEGLLKAYPYGNDISHFLALGDRNASILVEGSRSITTVDAVVQNSYEVAEGDDDLGAADALDDADLTGLDISVVPIAGLTEPGRGAVWGSAAFLVDGGTDARTAAAWDFMKFFNSTDSQVKWLLQGSYLPVTETAQNAPEVTAYLNDTTAGRWLGVANEQLLALGDDLAAPVMGPYNQFRAGMHSMLDEVVIGNGDPATGLADFDAQFQRDLDRYAEEVR